MLPILKIWCFYQKVHNPALFFALSDSTINFIPHLSYLSHILGVMIHCYCYLQGPGCNIVDFAIKLTALVVGKVRLASHKRLFDPRLVVFQLFTRNTEDLFCFEIAIAFFVLHPPYSALVWPNTCFCSFISHCIS